MEKNLHIANGKDSISFIAYLNYSVWVRYLRCLRVPTYAISMLEDACVCNFGARERRLVYIKFLELVSAIYCDVLLTCEYMCVITFDAQGSHNF